jgi:hypothetical protein
MDEALGLIDGCPVGQGNDHAHAGYRHQPPTNRIMADCVEKHFVEDGKLLPHDPPDGKYWLDEQREPGRARDQLADPRFEFPRAHHADLESSASTHLTWKDCRSCNHGRQGGWLADRSPIECETLH